MVTLAKPEDLYLTLEPRQYNGRPVAVLDPFDLGPGVPELLWDPVAGFENPMLAERRAKVFAAGTIKGASLQSPDEAARFYAGECVKVLQAYFHAAALAVCGLDELPGQLVVCYGEDEARTIYGLSNNLVVSAAARTSASTRSCPT